MASNSHKKTVAGNNRLAVVALASVGDQVDCGGTSGHWRHRLAAVAQAVAGKPQKALRGHRPHRGLQGTQARSASIFPEAPSDDRPLKPFRGTLAPRAFCRLAKMNHELF